MVHSSNQSAHSSRTQLTKHTNVHIKRTHAYKAGMYHVIVNVFLGNYMRCETQVVTYGRRTLL